MSPLPVAEAQARLLALGDRLPEEQAPLADCTGRWLARPVAALRDQPAADLSAMDGYAIAHADLPGPWTVAGESAAGAADLPALQPGQAMRIFTGAPVPPRADTVIIQENVDRDGDRLTLPDAGNVTPGMNIRARGSDFARDQLLLDTAARLTPARIALAALAGHASLPVRRRPRIALISTGNELVPPGPDVPTGKLPSSNAIMLQAMLHNIPCEVEDHGIVGDDLPAMKTAFERARTADIVVTTGGASVGDHDLVRPTLEGAGGTLDFWKIRMRPGKPLIAGRLGEAIFLGLPGNPVSAFVTAYLFLLPLARHLQGDDSPLPPLLRARLASPLRRAGERDEYLRARLDAGRVHPLSSQDSAATASLAEANCLICRPGGAEEAKVGEEVGIYMLG